MEEELAQHQQAPPPLQQYLSHIVAVRDNDVLSGRGVNIAAHYGNERFRTLITTRADENYCEGYSASEKRAVAEEIVRHIASLDPPGRFLKREGRGQVARGLNGPWDELSRKEAIKKTCQALRDCNRKDRVSYGRGVAAPDDVKAVADEIANSGVDLKNLAKTAALNVATETSQRLREAMAEVGVPEDAIEEQIRRQNADSTYVVPGFVQISDGSFIPYAQPGGKPPIMQQVIGKDGLAKPAEEQPPPPAASEMPGIYSMYPHPAVDMPPINMEHHLAARKFAGYVHPDDRERVAKEEAEARALALSEANEDEDEEPEVNEQEADAIAAAMAADDEPAAKAEDVQI